MGLLRNLQPTWWFAAHLHTRFEARVRHDLPEPRQPSSGPPPRANNPDEITIDEEEVEGGFDDPSRGAATVPSASIAPQNPDEITLEDEIGMVEPPPPPPRETKFLALDKCLPRRQFLEASVVFPPCVADTNINNHPTGGRHPRARRRRRERGTLSGAVLRPRMARDNARLPGVPLAGAQAGEVPRPRCGAGGRRARVGLGARARAAEAWGRMARRRVPAVRARWRRCASADRGVCDAA